ncbi:hypothetical protein A2U01_0017766, partial [Trifolium medium]|nr:hypothetical protein [Trifolium medium]
FAAIDVFLAVRNEGQNPVPTVLGDTYYTLDYCHSKDTEEHRRIRTAWNQIIQKGSELGKRGTDAHDSYRQWVKKRVHEIKLPFHGTPSNEEVVEFQTAPLENTSKKEFFETSNKRAKVEE